MGAWGPAIFSDDTACDIRDDYRELLEDAEATRRTVEAFKHLGEDEAHVLWLALAAAQAGLGRLDDDVKERALLVTDGGQDLELWKEAGPKELAKRKVASGQVA